MSSEPNKEKPKPAFGIGTYLSIAFITAVLAHAFYIPPRQARFMDEVERQFQQTDSTVIPLRNLTDFEWDAVCYFGTYTSEYTLPGKTEEIPLPAPYKYIKYSPFYSGSFVFFRDGKKVKALTYHTWGLDLSSEGLVPMHIEDDGRRYSFMSENAFEGDYCRSYGEAALAQRTSYGARIPSYRIVLKSIKEE